jgi:hypothetical protein
MEKKVFEGVGKSNTPLEIERTISLDDKYVTLFTAKQIGGRLITSNP